MRVQNNKGVLLKIMIIKKDKMVTKVWRINDALYLISWLLSQSINSAKWLLSCVSQTQNTLCYLCYNVSMMTKRKKKKKTKKT